MELNGVWRNMRLRKPLVQCVTNRVTAQRVTDFLLVCGASPFMSDNPHEVEEFAEKADALYVNAGLHLSQIESLDAICRFRERWKFKSPPFVVVDPVAIGSTEYRTQQILSLLRDIRPDLIKGNAAEILSLADGRLYGAVSSNNNNNATAGIEVDISQVELSAACCEIADRFNCVAVATGCTDIIVESLKFRSETESGGRSIRRIGKVEQDVHMLTKMSGRGDAVGAICAAALVGGDGDHFLAAVTAVTAVKHAAKEARASGADGPGSLSVGILDKLYKLSLSPDALNNFPFQIEERRE